jgi:hypothetical protein
MPYTPEFFLRPTSLIISSRCDIERFFEKEKNMDVQLMFEASNWKSH